MKKSLLFTLSMLMLISLKAQVSSYIFSSSMSTYTPITGGTVLGTSNNDSHTFMRLEIGFPFCFNGQVYTDFGVMTNGFVVMGVTSVYNSASAISTGTNNNLIAGLCYDLSGRFGSELSYKTIGTAPNRELVVQWSNYGGTTVTTDTVNFQVRLHETSNIIDVVYGHFVPNNLTRTPEVGLRGNSTADFNKRYMVSGVHTWLTTIAGTTSIQDCILNNTGPLFPPSGLKFTWSPASTPAAPVNMAFTVIGYNTTTVRWNDNSTTEQSFALFRSTDNVNFTFVTSLTSTSMATTGTLYQFAQTDLFAGTLYYYRVMAVSNSGSAYLTGQQSTTMGTMCGTYTIGPSGNYVSLGAAFTALAANGLNCGVLLELLPAYSSAVETFPLSIPSLPTSPTLPVTVRPAIGATGLIITSSAAQTILINGTDFLRFDGRPGGIGINRELTIDNTSLTGIALQVQNGAQFNRVSYITLTGVNDGSGASSGVVFFSNSTATSGNDGNVFEHCDFTSGVTPVEGFFMVNQTTGKVSRLDTIIDCVFHDWYTPTAFGYGITLAAFASDWVVSGNSFYQNDSLVAGAAEYVSAIIINSSAFGSGHKIIGNFIGGSGPQCSVASIGGHPQGWGAFFTGIEVYASSGRTPCLVKDNLITNICAGEGAGNSDPYFTGIKVSAGDATLLSNTIGSSTDTARIIIQKAITGGASTSAIGIYLVTPASVVVDSNRIGGMIVITHQLRIGTLFGISIGSSTGAFMIRNNLIGSTTCANSITNSPGTGNVAGGTVGGISGGGNDDTYCEITSNTIANISNRGTGTASIQMFGIRLTACQMVIRENLICALSCGGGQSSGMQLASQMGICVNNLTNAPQDISNNRIHTLKNTAASGSPSQSGIYCELYNGPAHKVSGNSISSITSNGFCGNYGITANGGTVTYSNNMIVLGIDTAGNSHPISQGYYGIYKYSTSATKFYHNSIRITGATPSSHMCYAFQRGQTGIDEVVNNIFENTRNTTFGTAVLLNNATTLTLDYNNYYLNPSIYFGRISTANYTTLAAWQTITGGEANALTENPNFISAVDLHLDNTIPSFMESAADPSVGITDDFDHDVRPGPVNSTNGGGIGPDIGADEFDGIIAVTDLALLSLNSPADSCHNGPEIVSVLLKNTGNVALNFSQRPFTINGNVTGPNALTFTPVIINSGTLAPNAQMPVTLSAAYNMSASGTYTFYASVAMAGDSIAANNSMIPDSMVVSAGSISLFNAPVCAGDTFLLVATDFTTGGAVQWQSSPDGITWSNVSGATNDSLSTATNDTTYYRNLVCGTHASAAITINIGAVAPPTVQNVSVCDSGTVTLQANGNGNFEWYAQSQGGTSLFSGPSFNVFANVTITYYAEAEQNGCRSTRTPALIQVFASPLVDLGNDTTVCGTLLLNAGNNGSNFSWSDGAATQTTLADSTGNWWVMVMDTNGCSSIDTIFVQADPLPAISINLPFDTACLNGGVLLLNGATPLGGNWSGNGVSGTSFDPFVAGLGGAFILYQFTDANSCTAIDSSFVHIEVCTDVTENDFAAMQIVPNPATNYFSLSIPATYSLRLFNASGALVMEETLAAGAHTVKIGTFVPGVYFLVLTDANGKTSTQKLVKLAE